MDVYFERYFNWYKSNAYQIFIFRYHRWQSFPILWFFFMTMLNRTNKNQLVEQKIAWTCKETIVKKTVIATRDGTARKSKSFILIYKSGSLNGGTKSIRIPLRTKECLSSFLSIVLLSMNGKKREPEFHRCGLSDNVWEVGSQLLVVLCSRISHWEGNGFLCWPWFTLCQN